MSNSDNYEGIIYRGESKWKKVLLSKNLMCAVAAPDTQK